MDTSHCLVLYKDQVHAHHPLYRQDVLQAAKERACREKKTTGKVISELARRALTALPVQEPEARYGFRPFGKRGGIVTNELIDTLREDDPY